MEESEKTIELILTSTAGVILVKITRYANEQCFIAPYLDKVICIKINWNENNNISAKLLLYKFHPQTHTNSSVKQVFSSCPWDQEKN